MNTKKRILHIALLMALMLVQSVGVRAQASDYTISFDLNGGIGYLSPQSITIENIGGTAALPTISNIIPPNGKAFAGWAVTYNGYDESTKDAIKFYDGETIDYELVVEAVAYSEETSITFVAQWMDSYSELECNEEGFLQTQVISNPTIFPYCCVGNDYYIPIPPGIVAQNPTWRTEPWKEISEICTPDGKYKMLFVFRPKEYNYQTDNVESGATEYNGNTIYWKNSEEGYADVDGEHYKLTVVNYIRRRLPDVIVTQEMIDNDAFIDKFNTPNCGLVGLEFPFYCQNTFGVGTTSAMRVTKYHCQANGNYYEDTVYYKVGEIEPEIINRTITVLPWDVNNGSVVVIASDPEHTTATHEIHTFHPIYNTQDGTVTLPANEVNEAEGDWIYTGDDQTLYKMHYTVEFVGYFGRRVDHAYVYEWVNKHIHEEPGYIDMPYPDATLKYYIGDGITTIDKNGSPITVRCGIGTIISGVEDVWIFDVKSSYNLGGIEIPTGIYRTEDAVFHSDTITNLHYCPQVHSADSTIYTTSDHIEREIGKTFYVNQSPYYNVSFIDEPQPGSQQYKMFTFDKLQVVNGYHVSYAMNNPNMTGTPQSFWVTGEQKLPANPFQLAGHVFTGWQIEGTSIILPDQETVSFSILQNLTHSTNTEIGLIPTWAKTYTISTKVEDENHTEDPSIGSVNISVGGIPVAGKDTTVTAGTSVQLVAVAKDNCKQFAKWSDNNTQNPRSIIVGNSGATYTAVFEKKQFTITTAPDAAGHGTTEAVEYSEQP